MGVNSLPKTVTRQSHGCDLNPGPSAPESITLTIRPSHPLNNDVSSNLKQAMKSFLLTAVKFPDVSRFSRKVVTLMKASQEACKKSTLNQLI